MLQGSSTIESSGGAFIESNATIVHEGKSFSSGGAWLAKRVDTGKYQGTLYAYKTEKTHVSNRTGGYYASNMYPIHSMVGSWDGSIKIPAVFTNVWQSNMGDWRQNVYFSHTIDGIKHNFYGVFYCSGSDIVRVHEVK